MSLKSQRQALACRFNRYICYAEFHLFTEIAQNDSLFPTSMQEKERAGGQTASQWSSAAGRSKALTAPITSNAAVSLPCFLPFLPFLGKKVENSLAYLGASTAQQHKFNLRKKVVSKSKPRFRSLPEHLCLLISDKKNVGTFLG
jgi:hypothetical protein